MKILGYDDGIDPVALELEGANDVRVRRIILQAIADQILGHFGDNEQSRETFDEIEKVFEISGNGLFTRKEN